MYPRQKADEKETIYGINSRPKIQYFSKMPAVLTVFIKTCNNVIFQGYQFKLNVSCHMEFFNLFVEVPYIQGASWQIMLICAIGTTGLNV